MSIWFDVSDIIGWQLPHLTGIQRVSVGILDGLTAQGFPCWLVRYDDRRRAFVVVEVQELPETIRRHLPRLVPARSSAPDEVGAVGNPGVLQASIAAVQPAAGKPSAAAERRRVSDPATQRLRHSFRAFRAAARELHHEARGWVKTRLRPPAAAAGQPDPLPAVKLSVPSSADEELRSRHAVCGR